MGLRINVKRNGSGPIVDIDRRLNAGSLLLIDPAHAGAPWADGVPTADAYLPNLAATSARALIGQDAEVRSRFRMGTGAGTGIVLQRTPRGGLHGIVSQTSLVGGNGARIDIADSILAYISANPTHRFFISRWSDKTRISGNVTASSQAWESGIGTTGATATQHYHYAQRTDITRPNAAASPAPGGLRPSSSAGSDVLGMQRRNIATGGVIGTSTNPLIGSAIQWGAFGILVSGGNSPLNAYPSMVFYSYYLEDLTVSGLTYAQADAADGDMYSVKMTSAGGAYYGDAPASPAAVLA